MGRKLLEKDGSSPLTRGKLTCERTDHFSNRLIPAHAGKTVKQPPHPLSLSAHPRSRGENERGLSSFVRLIGSSPLTRGKHERVGPFAPGGRLIPAHAGKTACHAVTSHAWTAHPRSRGENRKVRTMRYYDYGSSPLTRGKPRVARCRCDSMRLIPAHAGKTRPPAEAADGTPAHPRSRGENPVTSPPSRRRTGSSPLTRGKRPRRGHRRGLHRLIPAHAGKTATRRN